MILIHNAVGVGALGLAEVREHRVDELKRLVDLLADFCAGEDLKAVLADVSHCS